MTNYTPQHELDWYASLTVALPPKERKQSASTRLFTKEERIGILITALRLLPYSNKPGWSREDKIRVTKAGYQMYREALQEVRAQELREMKEAVRE
jgi:hypothetical protein